MWLVLGGGMGPLVGCASVHLTTAERKAHLDPRAKRRGLLSPTRQVAVDDGYDENESEAAADGATTDGDGRPREGLLFGGGDGEAFLRYPVQGELSSPFGVRSGKPHKGVDLRAPKGTPIYPAAPGRVTYVGWVRGYGRTVRVEHGGFETLYAHCDSLHVKAGEEVGPGDKIATVGRSGSASGYHLHFEYINRHGENEDPWPYLNKERAYTYVP